MTCSEFSAVKTCGTGRPLSLVLWSASFGPESFLNLLHSKGPFGGTFSRLTCSCYSWNGARGEPENLKHSKLQNSCNHISFKRRRKPERIPLWSGYGLMDGATFPVCGVFWMQGTTRWRPGLELVTSHFAILHDVMMSLNSDSCWEDWASESWMHLIPNLFKCFFHFSFPFYIYLSVTSLATSQKNPSFGLVW